jgi:metal-responsive CopG/Arc/MetJ family transcriptional regulator
MSEKVEEIERLRKVRRVSFTVTIDAGIAERVDIFIAKYAVNRSRVTERALDELLQRFGV